MSIRSALVAAVLLAGASFATAQTSVTKPTEKAPEPTKREKGTLPTYWKQLGLTDDQIQKVYKLQNSANDEIETLEAKIKTLKEKLIKDRLLVLTKEQKERLEGILKEKAGGDKKDK